MRQRMFISSNMTHICKYEWNFHIKLVMRWIIPHGTIYPSTLIVHNTKSEFEWSKFVHFLFFHVPTKFTAEFFFSFLPAAWDLRHYESRKKRKRNIWNANFLSTENVYLLLLTLSGWDKKRIQRNENFWLWREEWTTKKKIDWRGFSLQRWMERVFK